MVKSTPFDIARHLDNPKVIVRYLAEAFQTRDSKLIRRAVSNVAHAVGVQLKQRRRERRQKSEFEQTMKVARKIMKKRRTALSELAKK